MIIIIYFIELELCSTYFVRSDIGEIVYTWYTRKAIMNNKKKFFFISLPSYNLLFVYYYHPILLYIILLLDKNGIYVPNTIIWFSFVILKFTVEH